MEQLIFYERDVNLHMGEVPVSGQYDVIYKNLEVSRVAPL